MTSLGPADLVLLSAAALAAGAVNAVAGGGSLITFPALLAVGYGAYPANVTNAVAVLPGYLGGSFAYRRELAGQGARARPLGLAAAAGALVGSVLLTVGSDAVFRRIVPYLILAACGLLAAQPAAARLLDRRRSSADPRRPGATLYVLTVAGAVYGGYFGAGLGIMLLALLGLCLDEDLHRLNALKGLLSLVVGVVSVAWFAVVAPVAWPAAGVMAVSSLLGGHLGVAIARRLPAALLRSVIVAFGTVVAIRLLV